MNKVNGIDEYLKTLPENSKRKITELRSLFKKLFPQAQEAIKYGLPTFVLQNKNLVHFGAYKNHIGFYPGTQALIKYAAALATYTTSKGAVKFPLKKALPLALIKDIVIERAHEINMVVKK